MAKVVNLRRARKKAARKADRAAADVNAARKGESKGAQAARAAQKALDATRHDGHRRDRDDG